MSTPERKEDDPRAVMAMAVVLIGALLVVVVVLGLQALYFGSEDAEQKAKGYGPPDELTRLRAGQLERITTYQWADPSHQVAIVPIDRAMDLVVRDQGRNPAVPVTPAGASPSAGAGR